MDGSLHDPTQGPADERPAARRSVAPRVWRIARPLLIGYLILMAVLMFLESRLLFFPAPRTVGEWFPADVAVEDAEFQAADGTRLHGWYLPCEQPRAVVLFSHGNGGNVTHWVDELRVLHQLRAAAMIYDYRGYGKSLGSPNEAGILQDARAARAWLAKRSGVKEEQIVQMGRSLGGGVAVDLAAHDGARGLILESTFTSLPDAAKIHYPLLPVHMLMRNRLNSADKIGLYRGPLLQSHGDRDRTVPIGLGRRLFEAANEPKRFVEIPGADHNDPQPPQYYRALDQFLGELP